ncbi:NAD-dependent epimerase/dehydratase family protein [Phytohabitans sp. ZYX-F-186]|uniref:NAD-dependent epimerase/dehydratase family protein n=1 Tax=Phytohabitans maris TaxID=3071409 RepID=A0ABU0ZRH0_9ACTN|nr:NAD-dependent epimerase/dehydratase family protein [Phytohabitans sp. ZYX-F-186]MDQ7908840.1 NAD-dependent epimerase/dehydratase family protein [Phytohabitans sp. ZYX-F-186]
MNGGAVSLKARALILGGADFFGLHLARRLVTEGYHVVVVDTLTRGRDRAEVTALGATPGVELIGGDLTDPATWAALRRGWAQIYLLPPAPLPKAVESDPVRAVRGHALAALHLIDWAAPGDKVFFASSGEVYADGVEDGVVQVPTEEAEPVVVGDLAQPRSAYAASRLFAEAALVHAARAGRSRVVVGRFYDLYGPRMGTDQLIPQMCVRAIRGEDPFLVKGPHRKRAFCYVDDAVEATLRLMEAPAAVGEIVHIGNDEAQTAIGDLARRVLRIAGVEPRVVAEPAPPGSPARRAPDLAKLRRLTGFEPSVELADGLRRTFYWYRRTWAS